MSEPARQTDMLPAREAGAGRLRSIMMKVGGKGRKSSHQRAKKVARKAA
jgi:hypothetical protein